PSQLQLVLSLLQQQTAYEIETCLEFRRGLFRSVLLDLLEFAHPHPDPLGGELFAFVMLGTRPGDDQSGTPEGLADHEPEIAQGRQHRVLPLLAAVVVLVVDGATDDQAPTGQLRFAHGHLHLPEETLALGGNGFQSRLADVRDLLNVSGGNAHLPLPPGLRLFLLLPPPGLCLVLPALHFIHAGAALEEGHVYSARFRGCAFGSFPGAGALQPQAFQDLAGSSSSSGPAWITMRFSACAFQ